MTGKTLLVLGEINGEGNPSASTIELGGLAVRFGLATGTSTAIVFLGRNARSAAEEMATSGAERLLYCDDARLNRYHPEFFAAAIEQLYAEHPFDVLLAGHTPNGQDLLPRLAFSLDGALVTDCVELSLEAAGDGLCLACVKPVYGGNVLATFALDSPPMMATVRPRVGEPPGVQSGEPTELTALPAPRTATRIELGEMVAEETEGPKLEEAGVVVAGGRGMGGEEGFEALGELADLLGGALGASRPACDAGWASTSLQVGITGKMVAPDTYVAVGISGSSQHLSGMLDSRAIVAINKDPEADIFKVSSYGAVGEWQQMLPAFISRLRRELEERGT